MQIEQGVYALGRVGIVEERIYVLCRVDIIEEGVYALCRVGGWYKILGRSESQAVKKPSNRGGCDACSGAHRSPTHCIGSQTDFITTSWKSTRVKGNNKMNNTK